MSSIFNYLNSDELQKLNIQEKPIYYKNKVTTYKVLSNGIILNTNYNKSGKTKVMSSHKNHGGYHILNLHIKGEIIPVQIHRLVALAFIPNDDPEHKTQVNHKDGNKDNNDISNLEWMTPKANMNHAVENELIKTCENSPSSKFTNKQIHLVCKRLEENQKTIKEIAKEAKVTVHIVRDVLRKKTWKKISCNYKIDNYTVKDEPGTKGERNNKATITEKTVRNICKDIESNKLSLTKIAEKYNVRYKIVQYIYNGTTWQSVSKDYKLDNYNRKDHFKK